ncbi:MAG: hypothetical protein M1836_005860 [Candelina mexicana]|nr:MAG: hypothetical protein M1836_005860 [Candelina mexicana]
MYTIGERYDIWALKDLAQQKFGTRANNDGWNSEGFSLAIREVYEWSTDEDQGLRQSLVTIAANNVKTLRDKREFNNVISEVPDFTQQLLTEVLKASSKDLYCEACWDRARSGVMVYDVANEAETVVSNGRPADEDWETGEKHCVDGLNTERKASL